MKLSTFRRGATCSLAALALAVGGTPLAHAQGGAAAGSVDASSVSPDSLGERVGSVGEWAAASVSLSADAVTDPVGSATMLWESVRCFIVLPSDGPEDNCWY